MFEFFFQAGRWLLVAFFGGQGLIFIGVVLWIVWTDAIKPRMIPADDIERVADDIMANFADPEQEAFARLAKGPQRTGTKPAHAQ